MESKEIKKFIYRLLLFTLPFLLLILSFIILDPFKVLYSYSDFSNSRITLNPDYISTEVYLHNRKKHKYDSFIFGSSKTLAYKTNDWVQYLENSSPFVFHASFESLYGIWKKIKLIDANEDAIKNAIIILDETVLQQTVNLHHHLNTKHPVLSNEGWLGFYNVYFKAYLSDFFFVFFMDYSISNTVRPYMRKCYDDSEIIFDPITNDMLPMKQVKDREKDPEKYIEKMIKNLPPRDPSIIHSRISVIGKTQMLMLKEILEILKRHQTDYKIIIGPNYDQIKLNKQDLSLLENTFEKENIYDYSGINEITNDLHNYYDKTHYSVEIGRKILKEVYGGDKSGAE